LGRRLWPFLALEGLAEAGRVLEGGEAGRRLAVALALAAHGGDDGRGSDEPAQQERAQPLGSRFPVHETIVGVLVCTLGDLLLDVIVRAPGPLAPGADTPVEAHVATGGQAANVASWVVELGENARFVGKSADDAAGDLARSLLGQRGVVVAGPRVEGSTGVVVAFVGPDGERSMATDRGVSPELRADELEGAWFVCDCLHLSGYSLLASPIGEAALAAAERAREEGARVSVDLSSWSTIRAFGPERFRARLEELTPDLVFANEPEWELVGGAYGLAETAVVKRGSRGVVVMTADGSEEHASLGAEVVDTTGAGDALAAGFLVGGIDVGLQAAARCVAQMGAVPV
jgi:sugar/nucleoside kinase (ribokinase family)